MNVSVLLLALLAVQNEPTDTALIHAILEGTEPLEAPRGDRLPLYIWPAHRLGTTDESEIVEILQALEVRGMTAIASWRPNDPAGLEEALQLGRLQSRLELPISVSATSSTYAFFNGDPSTAHIDADGNPFFDDSFQTSRKMGCPFAIHHRIPEMTERIASAVRAYDEAGLEIDFLYADWEIDGPLEKAVRKHEGTGSGEFVTLTISMPVELLSVWHDTYELAERVSGGELEKWQVLEPALAEFMSTYLAAAEENQRALFETEDEKGLSYKVRDAVFTRDGYQCVFPGCSARKTLDPHHILYKSRGGSDDPSNIVSLCRIHHALIHKGTCSVTGRVGVDLKFERPQLVTKKPAPEVEQAPIAEPLELPDEDDGSEDWRDETVAAIFDGPPSPPPAERTRDYGNVIDAWGAQQLAFERERRSRRRRASEHVFAEASVDDATSGSSDRASPDG